LLQWLNTSSATAVYGTLAPRLPRIVPLTKVWYESPRGPSLVARSTPLLLTNAVLIRFDTSAATAIPAMFLFSPTPTSLVPIG
jgi:hypothetical protein